MGNEGVEVQRRGIFLVGDWFLKIVFREEDENRFS